MKEQPDGDDEEDVQDKTKRNEIGSVEQATKQPQEQDLREGRYDHCQQGDLTVRQVQALPRTKVFDSQGSR